jgi:hypothetical protein
MEHFVTFLRDRVDAAQRELKLALDAGHAHEIDLRRGRLRDLLDVARRQGVDTAGWVDPALPVTTTAED